MIFNLKVIIGAGVGSILGQLILELLKSNLSFLLWKNQLNYKDKKGLANEVVRIVTQEDVMGQNSYNKVRELVNKLNLVNEKHAAEKFGGFIREVVTLELLNATQVAQFQEKEHRESISDQYKKVEESRENVLKALNSMLR